jgi:peptidase M28-like protein
MFQGLLAAVRSEASGDRALESVRTLSRFHRVQASPGYDAAADWLAARIESYGLEAEIETVAGDGRTRCLGQLMPEGWACTRAVASLVDGGARERLSDYEAEKLSLILRSTPARGRFPLIVVEDGTRDADYQGRDVRGKVVLTRGAVQRVHELAVVGRGAAGILSYGRRLVPPVRDRFDDPDALAYTSFWWGEADPRGWGFVVSPRVGEGLVERLAGGAALALEVEIESRAFPTGIPLVSTRLAGEAPGEVLVLAHLCHPEPSANDNASGVAAALEAARVLTSLRASGGLPTAGRSVRFLWVPEMTGTYAWLARDPERARNTLAAVNLDMVGQDQNLCGSTFLLEHPPHYAGSFAEELLLRIRAEAVDWVSSYSGPGHYSMTRLGEVPFSGGSDHYVLIDPATDVPCPMLIQWPDRYYHSSHDTPDKTDPASLALAVRCAATYAGFVASAGEAERRWLLGAVGRGARRRLLAAADDPSPGRAAARELARGERALASVARLGLDRAAIAGARERLAAFAAQEAPGLHADPDPPGAPERASAQVARWRRTVPVPVHAQRHLLEGWGALPSETRERWRAREAEQPDGALLCDLAWYACDGRRSPEEIARLVWLETGRYEPGFIGEFFELMEALGLSVPAGGEEAACRSKAPDTATR